MQALEQAVRDELRTLKYHFKTVKQDSRSGPKRCPSYHLLLSALAGLRDYVGAWQTQQTCSRLCSKSERACKLYKTRE